MKMIRKAGLAAVMVSVLAFNAYSIDIKGLLGGAGNIGDVVSGVVDGLLTKTDITVEEMAGTWTATGSAVAFQSDNYLKKAGGSAAAATIESKLDPYFKQYGLTGSVLTIDKDGNFTLKVKSLSLKGVITKRQDGNFDFSFTPFGGFKLGAVTAYVEKPMTGLNVMFDASKLKTLISVITKLTGNSLASAAGSLLESYDGLCVGFAYSGQSTYNPASSGAENESSPISDPKETLNKAGNLLKGIMGN